MYCAENTCRAAELRGSLHAFSKNDASPMLRHIASLSASVNPDIAQRRVVVTPARHEARPTAEQPNNLARIV